MPPNNIPEWVLIGNTENYGEFQWWAETSEPATHWYVSEQRAIWIKFRKGIPMWWGFPFEDYKWRTPNGARNRELNPFIKSKIVIREINSWKES